jgi:hypothetical protein
MRAYHLGLHQLRLLVSMTLLRGLYSAFVLLPQFSMLSRVFLSDLLSKLFELDVLLPIKRADLGLETGMLRQLWGREEVACAALTDTSALSPCRPAELCSSSSSLLSSC